MADLPVLNADDFRELNLLPRVIFSVGGVILVGAFYVRVLPVGLVGLAFIFAGVGLNLAVDVAISTAKTIWWWGVVQAILCAALAILFLFLACKSVGITFYIFPKFISVP